MTTQKCQQVRERLKARFLDCINEGYTHDLATRLSRQEILSELKDEGVPDDDATCLISEAQNEES